MATIGLRYAAAAQITTETAGQAIGYGAGVVIGRAISASISWERNSARLDADDVKVASDNSLIGGNIDFGLDNVSDEGRKLLFGDYEADDSGEWEDGTESAPYVGFGTVCGVLDPVTNKTKYQAMWLHKVQFAEASESYQTKGQNVQYQTPTITGAIMAVYNNADHTPRVRTRKTFDTAAEAIAWINSKANLTEE